MTSQLRVKKLDKAAKLPSRGTDSSGGLDLFVLETVAPFMRIPPGGYARVPTGIAVEIPPGFVGLIRPRSSAFAKNVHINGTIDSDYRGDVFICIQNTGTTAFELTPGKSYAQLLIIKYEQVSVIETEALSESKRDASGFGSTGNT